jgi:molybdate transport system substrate-binding protein
MGTDMSQLHILSGGAAHGLVKVLEAEFAKASGQAIGGTFGAVGAMRAKLAAGEPADVVILTSAIVRELAAQGIVAADSVTDLGGVETGVAIRSGDATPVVSDAESLSLALIAADEIYFPDPQQATAGIHFAAVLEKLGISTAVASRLRTYPNGATAMKAMAASTSVRPIGCTQVTEIIATAGATLIQPLPTGFGLTTVYTAGVIAASKNQAAARQLVALLSAPSSANARKTCGFV